jgi:hypothetical protein
VHPLALVVVQLLHGATFGAMHLAAMRALLGLKQGLAGRAQALLASAVSASTGGLIWLSGPLYARSAGRPSGPWRRSARWPCRWPGGCAEAGATDGPDLDLQNGFRGAGPSAGPGAAPLLLVRP